MSDPDAYHDIQVLLTELRSLRLSADEHAEAKRQLAQAIEKIAASNPEYAALLRQEKLP